MYYSSHPKATVLFIAHLLPQSLVRQLRDELCSLRDEDGNTPLHIAAGNNNMQAIENGLLDPEIWDEDDDSDEEEGDSDDKAESDGEVI